MNLPSRPIDKVALRKESVDRNMGPLIFNVQPRVALRKESVDRNGRAETAITSIRESLSARRAWIEIDIPANLEADHARRSPQGERG